MRAREVCMTVARAHKLSKTSSKNHVQRIHISHQSVFLCIAIGAFLIANTSFLVGEQLKFYRSIGLSLILALPCAFVGELIVVFFAAFGMACRAWFRRILSFLFVTGILAFNYYHPFSGFIKMYFGHVSLPEPILLNKLQILIMLWNLILGGYAGYLLRNLVRTQLASKQIKL